MLKINIQDKLKEKGLNKNQFSKLMRIGYPAACALYDGTTTRISFDTLETIFSFDFGSVMPTHPPIIIRNYQHQINSLLAAVILYHFYNRLYSLFRVES